MRHEDNVAVVRNWQEAANDQDIDRLLELSAPDVEIVGPRGSGYGHELLRVWLSSAGLKLETLRTFARNDAVVMFQHGVWRSQETGEITGAANVATRFLVQGDRIAQLARYDGDDGLDIALEEAGLGYGNEA